jgi:hypothetical protein
MGFKQMPGIDGAQFLAGSNSQAEVAPIQASKRSLM